MIIMKTLQA